MIGVGVTVHNRHAVAAASIEHIRNMLPPHAKLVIVDDGSSEDAPFEVDYKFPTPVGIARAKNKCLELLDDCEHVFLFDDDTYPTERGWWQPYVDSPEAHLMYVFVDFADGSRLGDTAVVYRTQSHTAYSHARGCMLYFKRCAIDAVGGFDPAFGKWGWEHVNLSDRIHAAGLTTFPYMDVTKPAIYSGDEHRQVATTVGRTTRLKCAGHAKAVYDARKGQPYYVDYRAKKHRNVVLTEYFADMQDVQRGIEWAADYSAIEPLEASVARVSPSAEFVVLHNCFEPGERLEVGEGVSPYWQRWVAVYSYLMANPDIDKVWCVDATDVEMLRDPFPHMAPGVIYVGDEPQNLAIPWMLNNHRANFLRVFFRQRAGDQLLNCGLIGGSREGVMELVRGMLMAYQSNKHQMKFNHDESVGDTEMGVFNYVVGEVMRGRIEHGPHVNTRFKSFTDNGQAWWRHK